MIIAVSSTELPIVASTPTKGMNPASEIGDAVASLREGTDFDSLATPKQQLYERWLKCARWPARSVALPLLIGVDPDDWPAHLRRGSLASTEQRLWDAYCESNGRNRQDHDVEAGAVISWFRRSDCALPPSCARIYEFIERVNLGSQTGPTDAAEREADDRYARLAEREVVLGAALSLVSKMPDRCRDEHGFIDGKATAALIQQFATRWFPTQAPMMSEADMAALLERWLE